MSHWPPSDIPKTIMTLPDGLSYTPPLTTLTEHNSIKNQSAPLANSIPSGRPTSYCTKKNKLERRKDLERKIH